MKKDNDREIEINSEEIVEKIQSVGLNLTLTATLINFLEYGISDNLNFSNRDIENLIIVMRKILKMTINEYDEIEDRLDL